MDTTENYLQCKWHVHKIGGSILGTSENYSKVLDVIEHSKNDHIAFDKSIDSSSASSVRSVQAVVVSAMEGVTNTLLKLTQLAKSRDNSYEQVADQLYDKLVKCSRGLINAELSAEFESELKADITKIKEVLRAIAITQSMSEEMEDLIVGHGEVWSALLLTLYLRSRGISTSWLDTRKTLYVSKGECGPVIDWNRSESELTQWMKLNFTVDLKILIVTGFIACSPTGMPTTLQRNGSDYSASIFGALLKSKLITIWKDVDGLFSADPKIVPKATILKEISYHEVSELSYYGANILHPHTMPPAIKNNIPIRIRNFFNLSNNGSLIHSDSFLESESIYNVKGFSAIRKVSLINVEGAGLGVSNLAQRVFLALRDVKVSVLLISQGSSQSSICIAIPEKDGDIALEAIKKEFFNEIKFTGHIQTVIIELLKELNRIVIELVKECSIIAAVGDKMVSSIGVASKFFSALTKSGVNIKAIAQGSSERNISAVLVDKDTPLALRAVHSTFYRPFDPDVISIGIVGPGLIGSELIEQIKRSLSNPTSQKKLKHQFVIRAITNSKRSLFSTTGIDLGNWKDQLDNSKEFYDLDKMAEFLSNINPRHSVIIDCSANKEIPKLYSKWLSRGVHVITPNKVGFSGTQELYDQIQSASNKNASHLYYETTVGGGLPIIHMLQQMVATGDRITKIEGIFSGTLSFIFNNYGRDNSKRFSDIVLTAKQNGYTEPDPRDDLNGQDFARKIIILTREVLGKFNESSVDVVSLIPKDDNDALNANTEEFLSKHLIKLDSLYDSKRQNAIKNNSVLRYSGVIEFNKECNDAKASVSLREYPTSHPFANLTECDNIIAIYSDRYNKTPLVIQGPGAGATVTAAGIFGDLNRLSLRLEHV
ncbi:predicted protein [Heterostelium album PN500]|uniref:ACT domain-containing protein n=1 Tax=Heterostelium pallidum (strain ATCC 26659 / Pp 5 / PN500) TaxID=670386 RepID=D3BT16_HETP5|nr:predicted protein [Heterostelium album PN500]EFA75631.1 predicted protein [Heterostelium album PN500]|eukprot:XP_020427765.1 predicted protein [Heterostelium album PN500]